jgi:hypothetical protein
VGPAGGTCGAQAIYYEGGSVNFVKICRARLNVRPPLPPRASDWAMLAAEAESDRSHTKLYNTEVNWC